MRQISLCPPLADCEKSLCPLWFSLLFTIKFLHFIYAMKKEQKSLAFALSAIFLWSTVATAFKLSLKGMSPEQLLFFASLTSAIVLGLLAHKNENLLSQLFSRKVILKNILFGLINPFLYYLVLFKAYDLLPAQEAQPLNYTWPITVSIFSIFFLGEKFNLRIFSGLLLSFFGIIIIATRGNLTELKFENPLGTTLALLSAVIWAIFWTINIKDKRPASIKLFASFFYGSFFTFIYLLIINELALPQFRFLLGAVYVGLFEMGITFFLWLKGLNLSSNRTKTATLAYLSPFISLLFIAFILKEEIRFSSIIGLTLIVGGIIIQNTRHKPSIKNSRK